VLLSDLGPGARVVVRPLDTALAAPILLYGNGRPYKVSVEAFYCYPLWAGMLEWGFMDPEESQEELEEFHRDELEMIEATAAHLTSLWPGWEPWTLITPTPDWRDPEFQQPRRWQGNLCAARLRSVDDSFPVPYRGDDGHEEPAQGSEASVMYTTWLGEGYFPERIARMINWEQVAQPIIF
jgi:hypothetical protein